MNEIHILEQISSIFEEKQEADGKAVRLQKRLGQKCAQAHKAGISDRQISEYIGQELSRTRIQQLRSRHDV